MKRRVKFFLLRIDCRPSVVLSLHDCWTSQSTKPLLLLERDAVGWTRFVVNYRILEEHNLLYCTLNAWFSSLRGGTFKICTALLLARRPDPIHTVPLLARTLNAWFSSLRGGTFKICTALLLARRPDPIHTVPLLAHQPDQIRTAPLLARRPDQNRHHTFTCSSSGSVWNSNSKSKSAPLLNPCYQFEIQKRLQDTVRASVCFSSVCDTTCFFFFS